MSANGNQSRASQHRATHRVKWLYAVALVWALCIAGCMPADPPEDVPREVDVALHSANTFELLSLVPIPLAMAPEEFRAEDVPELHGYRVLGSAPIDDDAVRAQLVDALYRGIRESEGDAAACFNPRHGIRTVSDERTVEFVICFECLSMHLYVDGTRHESILTSGSPASTFNDVLDDANILRSER